MMQGDACYLAIRIRNNAGENVTKWDVQDVEITIGHLTKTYKAEQVVFYNGLWLFPMNQEESFTYRAGPVKAQVRIVWANGVVEGKPIYGVRFNESRSREVL